MSFKYGDIVIYTSDEISDYFVTGKKYIVKGSILSVEGFFTGDNCFIFQEVDAKDKTISYISNADNFILKEKENDKS
jgi:hypothetical protein